MKTTYRLVAWAILALGAVQVASTPKFFHGLTTSALYFASNGIALVLTGALNLLNGTYGWEAKGLRWASRAANVVMTGLIALEGVVDHADAIALVLVVGLLTGATALSLTPAVLASRAASGAA